MVKHRTWPTLFDECKRIELSYLWKRYAMWMPQHRKMSLAWTCCGRPAGNIDLIIDTRLQIRRRTPTLSGAVGIGTFESWQGADMVFLMPADEQTLPDPLRSGGLVFPSFGIPWVLLRSADPFKAIPITRLHDIPPTDRDQRATTQVP